MRDQKENKDTAENIQNFTIYQIVCGQKKRKGRNGK